MNSKCFKETAKFINGILIFFHFPFFFQILEILPTTIQSHLAVGVVVVTALVLVTSSITWCTFYLLVKCCKSCKKCSSEQGEQGENIEMVERQNLQQQQQPELQQQPERERERAKNTLQRTPTPKPKNTTTDKTRNGERCFSFN